MESSNGTSDKFSPDREEELAKEDGEDKDDESLLDEPCDEELNQEKKTGKKRSSNRQLWMDIQSAQGKSSSEDGKNAKRKAAENQEEL